MANKMLAFASKSSRRHVRAKISKRGKALNEPRRPSTKSMEYTTAYYFAHDLVMHCHLTPPDRVGRELLQSSWVGYPLFTEATNDIGTIPIYCRLDDLTLAKLIDSQQTKESLHANWQTEFDCAGMIKARRMPLGFAAKMWVNVGDMDRDGSPATQAG